MHTLHRACDQTVAAGMSLAARVEWLPLAVQRALTEVNQTFDRRGIYVHLTEAGRERHAIARPTQRAVLAAHLARTVTR